MNTDYTLEMVLNNLDRFYTPRVFESLDQQAFITIPKDVKRIGILISGGVDSTMAIYHLFKYIANHNLTHQINIVPMTGDDKRRPPGLWVAKETLEWLKEKHPTIKCLEHQVWDNTVPKHKKEESYLYDTKQQRDHRNHIRLIKELNIDMLYFGTTKNPPQEKIMEWGITERYPEHRNQGYEGLVYQYNSGVGCWVFRPWRNIDKRFVTGVWKTTGVFDEYYYETDSCIGHIDERGYGFMKTCGVCFWCKEREWGLNNYSKVKIYDC